MHNEHSTHRIAMNVNVLQIGMTVESDMMALLILFGSLPSC